MLQNLEVSGNLSGIAERCEREGETVSYRKGDQMEREGERLRVGERNSGIESVSICPATSVLSCWMNKTNFFCLNCFSL
jgi:hypothetical protein